MNTPATFNVTPVRETECLAPTFTEGSAALRSIAHFIPHIQGEIILELMTGEEGQFFIEKMIELKSQIDSMPQTYEQAGKGDQAVVHLHYFFGSGDWWITEKDMDGGVLQAFGLADLGYGGELGYISIEELCSCPGVELDLHWTPITIAAIKGKSSPEPDCEIEIPPCKVWERTPEEIKIMTAEEFQAAFDTLENENYHTENVILLAKRYGNQTDLDQAERILADYHAAGCLSFELSQERYALQCSLEGKPSPKPDRGLPVISAQVPTNDHGGKQ